MDRVKSNTLDLKQGVPQGSILGPLLYLIYTSNFFKSLKFCDYHFYADDTQLIYSFNPSNVQEANQKINLDLESLYQLSLKHQLKINPNKSVAILFCNENVRLNLTHNINITIGNNKIEFKESAKNLGLFLDNKLKFSGHVTQKLRLAYSTLKSLYSHRHYLSQDTKRMLCDSLVLSHLSFCDNVYGPFLDSYNSRRIQKLQNSCLRFIYGVRRRQGISHKLKEAGWLNMHSRRLLHQACFFYKILKFKKPSYLMQKFRFRSDVRNRNLRHTNLIDIPKHHKEIFKRSFSYNIAFITDKYKITDFSQSCDAFKKSLKKKLLLSLV